jgi:hypothetical protein
MGRLPAKAGQRPTVDRIALATAAIAIFVVAVVLQDRQGIASTLAVSGVAVSYWPSSSRTSEESPKGCGDPGSGYRIEPPPDISPRREDDPSGEGRHSGDHVVVEEVMP